MSKKVRRVPVVLDAGEIKDLPQEDIRMILRGADELISTGGRSMLAKILKGSKDKTIFKYKLNECPAYGYYQDMKLDDISKCIDWMIKEDYLRIEYDYRLPLLVFSEKGWQIEKETFAQELYQRMCLDVEEKKARVIFEMKEVNRQVVMCVLDKIEKDGTKEFLPYLEAWKMLEVKKVAARIAEVEKKISKRIWRCKMKILIFGMGNIGKSTVGELLARKIGYDFIDMDTKIKEKYGTMLGFQDEYNDQYERDELRAEMISSWIKENENVVIAPSPIAYLDAYEDFFEDSDIICFDLTDRAENIFKRLEFTDDNDNLLHIPQSYLNKHKAYYMHEIQADFDYFHTLYASKMDSISMDGKSLDEIVEDICKKYKLV